MPNLEIVRCTVICDTAPPSRQYGWAIHVGLTTLFSLPFRSPAARAHFLRLLAAYIGPAFAADAIEDLAAMLCLYHGDEEAAQRTARHLDADYGPLLTETPLEEVDDIVGLLLEEVAVAEEVR